MKTLIAQLGLLTCAFAFAGTVSAQPLVNFDFEDGTTQGWQAGPEGSSPFIEPFADSAVTGNWGLSVQPGIGGWGNVIQITCSPSENAALYNALETVYSSGNPGNYKLAFDCRWDNNGNSTWIRFHYIIREVPAEGDPSWRQSDETSADGDGNLSATLIESGGAPVEVWLPMNSSGLADVQAGAPAYQIYIGQNGDAAASYYFDVDNIRIEAIGGSSSDTWAEWPIGEEGWVDTGAFMGILYPIEDWIWSHSLAAWAYLPAGWVQTEGAWTWIAR